MNEKTTQAIKRIEQALMAINESLNDSSLNHDMKDQYIRFGKTLDEILRDIRKDNLPPRDKRSSHMGRTIIDSWRPLNSPLAELILSAEKAYLEL